MRKKLIFLFVFSSFLLSMCKTYESEPTIYANGLTCDNYVSSNLLEREEGADCSFTCPNGRIRQVNIPGTSSPMFTASQAELSEELCGLPFEPTPTEASATEAATQAPSPTVTTSPTAAASPTSAESATPLATSDTSPTAQVAATAASTSAASGSLLTGRVTMCDTGANLISFRITQPPPDLTGKQLTAQINEQPSTCYVNQTNTSLMTCTIPPGMLFPATIVVSVDGEEASEFSYDGFGCTDITTPIVTTTP
jgi:hypothetical protein